MKCVAALVALIALPFAALAQPSWRGGSYLAKDSTLLNGLTAYWALEESTGVRYDRTVNNFVLQSSNTVSQAAGYYNFGNRFASASSQFLARDDTPALQIGSTNFTISAWVNMTNTPTDFRYIVAKWNGGAFNRGYSLVADGASNCFAWVCRDLANANSITLRSPLPAIASNNWYHVLAEYDALGAQITLQVNNGTVYTTPITGGVRIETNNFTIGARQNEVGTWNGFIDEVKVWRRLLTPTEKQSLQTGFYPRFQNTYPGVWRKLTSMPEAKEQHGFEALNGVLYAVAGIGNLNTETNTVFAYDVAAGTWSQKADYPLKVQSLCLRAANGKLYGIGGYNSGALTKYTNIYEFDPNANTWTAKVGLLAGVEDMGSAVVSNKIYVASGIITDGLNHTITNKLQIYDAVANTIAAGDVMPNPRVLGDFGASNGTNCFYVSGTTDASTLYPVFSSSLRVDLYSPQSNAWFQVASLTTGACYKECEVINGKLYTMTGCPTSTTTYIPYVQIYNIANNTWSSGSPAPIVARGAAMAGSGGIIYLCGGYTGVFGSEMWMYSPE